MGNLTNAGHESDDNLLLTYGLLSCLAAKILSGIPVEGDKRLPSRDAELIDMLRQTFRERNPAVDVSDDKALGRAIEDLAIEFRDQAQR